MKGKPKIYFEDRLVVVETERCWGEVFKPLPYSKLPGSLGVRQVELVRHLEQQGQ